MNAVFISGIFQLKVLARQLHRLRTIIFEKETRVFHDGNVPLKQ